MTTLRRRLLRGSVVLCLALALGLGGCLPETPSPTPIPPTETATVTPTTTATIIWFPATATPTLAPTQEAQPTQDLSPKYGAVLYSDPFTDRTKWQTAQSTIGSVAYGKSELTLAVAEPKGTLASLRVGPPLENFYLEIDATPSLCRGGDNYGLLIRANSALDFYRLMVNCSAQLRVERYKNAYTTPLQDWVGSGQLFPGALMTTRLGVWAANQEFRIYINDVYQFTIKDPVFKSGTIGVYARSAADTPLTVSFSNLTVYRLDAGQIKPLPTPIPPPSLTPRPTATRRPTPTALP